MDVRRRQVVAWRVARHGLHRDQGSDPAGLAVLELGVQETGADSARTALAARLADDGGLGGTGEPGGDGLGGPGLALVWAHRGAPHVLRRAALAEWAGLLHPRSDADAAARLGACGRALRAAGTAPLAGFEAGAAALRAAVDGPVERSAASARVSAALPPEFSYACGPCGSTHVYGSLFQAVGLAAGVEVAAGTRPARLLPLPGRRPPPRAAADPGRVGAAYLRLHGPATPAELAAFLGTSVGAARAYWPRDTVEVLVEGRRAQVLAEDADALRRAPEADGLVRLLPPGDPLLQGRDREVLVPGAAHRALLWRATGSPGAVLAGGEVAGVWRARKTARRLEVAVEVFGAAPGTGPLEREAARVARARGLPEARLTVG